MKLLIIGNGFDIAHELPTKYWDFRSYLDARDSSFLEKFERYYGIYPETMETAKEKYLWNELEKNLSEIAEDFIVENVVNMNLGLEYEDSAIEDTLYHHYSMEYKDIELLQIDLKQWVRSIKIRDTKKKSSLITNESLYINFNYTSVLENVYGISSSNIIHIHGSLEDKDHNLVLGHGNQECIDSINEKIYNAQKMYDEKRTAICKVLRNFYEDTFKNVSYYANALDKINIKEIDEIYVIGHSLAGVDQYYFNLLDNRSLCKLKWKVYYYLPDEKEKLKNNLINAGVDLDRIELFPSKEFYDLQ